MYHSNDIDKSDDTRLYRVFYKGLPQFRNDKNILDIPALYGSREGIYKCLRSDYISPKRVSQIVALSQDAVKKKLLPANSRRILTEQKLLRFVIR